MDQKSGAGISLTGVVFAVLTILKVLGLTELSWFWVPTSLIWVPLIVVCFIIFILFILVIIKKIFSGE